MNFSHCFPSFSRQDWDLSPEPGELGGGVAPSSQPEPFPGPPAVHLTSVSQNEGHLLLLPKQNLYPARQPQFPVKCTWQGQSLGKVHDTVMKFSFCSSHCTIILFFFFKKNLLSWNSLVASHCHLMGHCDATPHTTLHCQIHPSPL